MVYYGKRLKARKDFIYILKLTISFKISKKSKSKSNSNTRYLSNIKNIYEQPKIPVTKYFSER